jgi:hypothetical protein
MNKTNKCIATINDTKSRDILRKMINSLPDELCGCSAKYFENDKWYCGKHAPSKIKERETKSYQKWIENQRKKQNQKP